MRMRTARTKERRPRPNDSPEERTAPVLPESGSITAIEQARRRGRYNVFVDGGFALALDAETLTASGLRVGMVLEGTRLLDVAAADLRKRALDAALRLLGYRPRAEREIRDRLQRAGLPPDVISATIARLRELALIDDAAFARAWVESRSMGSPRGQRLLTRELRTKGVDAETAAEAASASDDIDGARRAAEKKARSLHGLPYQVFRTRLAGYLQRRGFGYDTISPVITDLWREQAGTAPDDD